MRSVQTEMNFKLFSAEGKLNAFGNDHQYPPPQLMSLGSEGLDDHVLALMLKSTWVPRYTCAKSTGDPWMPFQGWNTSLIPT